MGSYLASVLEGDVDLAALKRWMCEGNGLPPAPSFATSPRSPTSDQWPHLTADYFRVLLLNFIKEEADLIFLAAEHTVPVTIPASLVPHSKARHVSAQPSRPPGLVDDNSFPTLSMVPTKVGTYDLCKLPRLGQRVGSHSIAHMVAEGSLRQKTESSPTL